MSVGKNNCNYSSMLSIFNKLGKYQVHLEQVTMMIVAVFLMHWPPFYVNCISVHADGSHRSYAEDNLKARIS